jgi:hypothetical protein
MALLLQQLGHEIQCGKPVERWRATSPALGLAYEAFEFRLLGTMRTITVKRFRVPINGSD